MTIPEITSVDGTKYSHFVFYKKGGMGEIYKGIAKKNQEDVILKLIAIDDPNDEGLLMREVDVSSALSHTNIVKTLSTGKIEIEGLKYLFIVQSYYPAGNLRAWLKQGIPLEKCIAMILDVLSGMKEVHKHIIHRDLKPENILVDSDGKLLITDFGLARYINEKTRTKSFKGSGTIPYMAPECWTGETNTISMDIYSLGILFFEILVGALPYNAKTESDWKDCHLFTPLPDISTYRSDITVKLKQIILKMTNKRVSDRYKSVDEIINAINDSIRLNSNEMQEVDRLAALGSFIMQQKNAEALRIAQENERTKNFIKSLNYNITELFNKFIEFANAVNARFETEKITISEQKHYDDTTRRNLTLTFNGKSINIQFTNYDNVEKYEQNMHDQSINLQKQMYHGIVFQSPEDSFLKTNGIVLVGLAETSFKIEKIEYGYNLLLKMQKDGHYGEWYIMSFKENITPPKPSFAISLSSFFKEYEKFKHHPYFTMEFRPMKDNDFVSLLEKIFILN
jgi:serine/threonine protein kinase